MTEPDLITKLVIGIALLGILYLLFEELRFWIAGRLSREDPEQIEFLKSFLPPEEK